MICRMRTGSPRKVSCIGSTRSSEKRSPLRCAVVAWPSAMFEISGRRRKGIESISSLPASIFEKSRMSLTMACICEALSRARSTCRFWLSSSGLWRSRSSSPNSPVKGVRNSWLMLATKALLARLAASARALSCCRAASADLRSEMSSQVHTTPRDKSAGSMALAESEHQKGMPLRRCMTISSRSTLPWASSIGAALESCA